MQCVLVGVFALLCVASAIPINGHVGGEVFISEDDLLGNSLMETEAVFSFGDTLESVKSSELGQLVIQANNKYKETKKKWPKESDDMFLLESLISLGEGGRDKIRKIAFSALSVIMSGIFSRACPAIDRPLSKEEVEHESLVWLNMKGLGVELDMVSLSECH